jgi:hypothetical protein
VPEFARLKLGQVEAKFFFQESASRLASGVSGISKTMKKSVFGINYMVRTI